MCKAQILHRLRLLQTGRKADRKPIKNVLQAAVDSIKQTEDKIKQKELTPLSTSFTREARKVMKLVDEWSNHQTNERLGNLVDGIYCLSRIGHLAGLLDIIPNREMNPNTRKSLVNMTRKVARYREAARFLYRTAKNFPVARNMKVVRADLPPKAFERIQAESDMYHADLGSAISAISPKYGGQTTLDQIYRLLGTTAIHASTIFSQQVQRMTKSKIHAEIQLICYYELSSSSGITPRVICSSKDACFLCNAFIRMHGKMYVPRSHGRLYPGWRLPTLSQFHSLSCQFNDLLETHIKQSLQMLLSTRKRISYPDPYESTVLTLPLSLSTKEDSEPSGVHVLDILPRLSSNTLNKPAFCEHRPHAMTVLRHETPCALSPATTDSADSKMPTISNRSSYRSVSEISQRNYFLSEGLSLSKHLGSKLSRLYATEFLELEIEAADLPSDNTVAHPREYTVEWLTPVEAAKVTSHSIIDAHALSTDDVSYSLGVNNSLYIAASGSVIRITFAPRCQYIF